MAETGLSGKVLGTLLVALQTLDVLPDVQGMAAFLQSALVQVPGISDARMCLNGQLPADSRATAAGLDVHCPKAEGATAPVTSCVFGQRHDIRLLNLGTPRQTFGCLQLVVDDEEQLAPYEPFLVNIGDMVATILEKREIDRSLAAANAELNELVNELEDRVKERTEELEAAQERYRLLAENASDVVMLATPDWIFEWVSGSVTDILGWQASELVGHRVEEFIHPDDLPQLRKEIADAGTGSPASAEFRYRRSDGTYRWVAGRAQAKVDEDGTPVAVVGGLVDIAERKATEARERERLAELERFKKLTVGRELRMIELKKEIEHLRKAARSTADLPEGR